jgi:hypothetical protein
MVADDDVRNPEALYMWWVSCFDCPEIKLLKGVNHLSVLDAPGYDVSDALEFRKVLFVTHGTGITLTRV